MRDQHGPLMVDLTHVMRRPKARMRVLLLPWKESLGAIAGAIVGLPIWYTVLNLGAGAPGFFLLGLSAVAGAALVSTTVRRQPPHKYLMATLQQRLNRVEYNGELVRVYSGLCPVQDVHDGTPFVMRKSAVEVDPRNVDEHGRLFAYEDG